MTQHSNEIEAVPENGMLHHPSDILLTLIVDSLVPVFLGVSAGDIRLARMAAIETVNAYQARNQADLIAVAQIIAFGLAALGLLSLSMADDLTLPMKLRLRGNALACNRSAEQNRRARTSGQADDQPPQHDVMTAEAEHPAPSATPGDHYDDQSAQPDTMLSPAAAMELAAEAAARLYGPGHTPARETTPAPIAIPSPLPGISKQRHQAMWAIAMVKEAGEISAAMASLPPLERRKASMRAAALSGTAHNLLYGTPNAARPAPPLSPHAAEALGNANPGGK